MKGLLLYFSGTGNTALLTRELRDALAARGVEAIAVSVEDVDRRRYFGPQPDSRSISFVAVGFPVYKFTYPRIMERGFAALQYLWDRATPAGSDSAELPKLRPSLRRPVPAFVYNTYCRFTAHSLYHAAVEVEAAGFRVVGSCAFKAPSNGIASLAREDSEEYRTVMYFEYGIRKKIDAFASRISGVAREFGGAASAPSSRTSQGYRAPETPGLLDSLARRVVERVERARYPRLSIDADLCTRCGLCVSRCPERNLSIVTGSIRAETYSECLHCLRCLHLCPAHAIGFGSLVTGPSRYTPATRRRLYEEACSTRADTAEASTPAIRRAWARRNVLYWLSGGRLPRRASGRRTAWNCDAQI